ncbi:DUF2809 domain-containing protein [Bradyrhizobium sediminis]|uniref:DUF2809 domain-containing protein n=1 Tax=Bradyrhizobium sediminis TaxID=2840469 RepID=A0A975RM91_9BRAD|nr:DUF2809 domain-containing protein [Bradyrhizobium sediminis]QWG12256.1 DUF2809 domain-containing protein [Bradyrhizobium sediminis]
MNGAAIDPDQAARRSLVVARAGLCLSVIVCGLALRGYGLQIGLPAFVAKYGGSTLWGTMVFFLVATAAPNLSRPRITLVAAAIAIGVELFRLVHFPWLDAFRLTLPGALLLGRIFSGWNVLAYGAGIVLAVLLDRAGPPLAGLMRALLPRRQNRGVRQPARTAHDR